MRYVSITQHGRAEPERAVVEDNPLLDSKFEASPRYPDSFSKGRNEKRGERKEGLGKEGKENRLLRIFSLGL